MTLSEASPLGWLKQSAFSILEFFLPRLCLFCGTAVGEKAEVAVCPECEAQIEWVGSPYLHLLRDGICLPGRRRPRLQRLPDRPATLYPGPGCRHL